MPDSLVYRWGDEGDGKIAMKSRTVGSEGCRQSRIQAGVEAAIEIQPFEGLAVSVYQIQEAYTREGVSRRRTLTDPTRMSTRASVSRDSSPFRMGRDSE